MIVRYALKCETCGQPHTVRIGMGQESSQTHKFPCRSCREEIEVRMDMDREKHAWKVACVENCEPIREVVQAPIVNVDANFLISPDEQGIDGAFPRLAQMRSMFHAAEKAGSLVNLSDIPLDQFNSRPYRQPDYAEEWKLLKRAWSLARSDQNKLSQRRIAATSAEWYPHDPLRDLEDWLWRFSLFVCQPNYEQPFRDVIALVTPLRDSGLLKNFGEAYASLSKARGIRYFTVMKEFYSNYTLTH